MLSQSFSVHNYNPVQQSILMKKIILISFALVISSSSLWAQPTHSRTLKSIKHAATKATADHNYFEALNLYQEAYSKYKDASLLLAMSQMNYKLRDYNQVIALTEKWMFEGEATPTALNYIQYARALKSMGQYEKAIQYFDRAINKTDDSAVKTQLLNDKSGAELALNMPVAKDVQVNNLGSDINTSNSEYGSFLDGNGNLYFSAITDLDPADPKTNATNKQAKIFMSQKSTVGFSQAVALGSEVNAEGYYHPSFALSADSKTMIFTRQRLGLGNQVLESKLYSAEWSNGKWSKVKVLPLGGENDLVKSPSIAQLDGKEMLLYVTNSAAGAGGYDIYMTEMGTYLSESSLGDMINTDRDEESPFVKDGVLYFSSKGHKGLGGFDIFQYRLGSDDMPVNMGRPYNSSADDIYFSLSDDDSGLLASNRIDDGANSLKGQTCCNDLYEVAKAKIELELSVVDLTTGNVVPGSEVQLLASNGELLQTISGSDLYLLAPDQEYQVKVSKEGYKSNVVDISTMGVYTSTILKESVSIEAIPEPEPETVVTIEKPIILDNILYEFDSDRFVAGSETDLNYLLKMLNENPTMEIRIASHTDSKGTASYNQKLSERRAIAVTRWLTQKGISANRLSAVGKGESDPIRVSADHAAQYSFLPINALLDDAFVRSLSKEQREIAYQLNRRSDFTITAGPKNIKITQKSK